MINIKVNTEISKYFSLSIWVQERNAHLYICLCKIHACFARHVLDFAKKKNYPERDWEERDMQGKSLIDSINKH